MPLFGPSVATDEYVQSGETVYAQASADRHTLEDMSSGTLTVTDSRLVFVDGSQAIDLDLQAIDEIVYHPAYLSGNYIFGTAILALVSLLAFGGPPLINIGPPELWTVAAIVGTFSAVGLGIGIITEYGARITVKTSQSTYQFRGDDIADIPHAIRGARDR